MLLYRDAEVRDGCCHGAAAAAMLPIRALYFSSPPAAYGDIHFIDAAARPPFSPLAPPCRYAIIYAARLLLAAMSRYYATPIRFARRFRQ